MKTSNRLKLGLILSTTVLVLMLGACGDDPSTPLDTTPPATIATLVVDGVADGTAVLRWTTPGDDGMTGRATSYDIRYSTDSATVKNNFSSATSATGIPAPLAAGTVQEFELNGLTCGETYFVAMKTLDEVPNVSGLSNIERMYCSIPPMGLLLPDLQTSDCDAVAVPLTVMSFADVAGVQVYVAYEPSHVTFDSVVSNTLDDAFTNDAGGLVSLIWADMTLASPVTLADGDTLAMFYFSDMTGTSALTFSSQTKVVDTLGAYFTVEKTDGAMTCTGK